MPLTLSGSGSITGLSAGGLPAGSVTSATLAAGAGGKILQVKESIHTAAVNAMSAGPVTINSGITVTIGSSQNWIVM